MKSRIVINKEIVGTLMKPNIQNGAIPMVLFLHGFGTSKDEVANTFGIAAQKLCENNIASLRIDFRGFGESSGLTSNLTIEELITDANSALSYILELDFIDINRIGLCGFSLGAGISILVSNKRTNTIKSMALLSPAGDLPEDFRGYLGFDEFDKLSQSSGELEMDLGWRKINLKKQFIESLKRHHLMDSVSTFKGSFFVAAGTNDFSYKHAENYVAKVKSDEKVLLTLDDRDHIFNAFDEDKSSIETVTDEVTTWFKRTL